MNVIQLDEKKTILCEEYGYKYQLPIHAENWMVDFLGSGLGLNTYKAHVDEKRTSGFSHNFINDSAVFDRIFLIGKSKQPRDNGGKYEISVISSRQLDISSLEMNERYALRDGYSRSAKNVPIDNFTGHKIRIGMNYDGNDSDFKPKEENKITKAKKLRKILSKFLMKTTPEKMFPLLVREYGAVIDINFDSEKVNIQEQLKDARLEKLLEQMEKEVREKAAKSTEAYEKLKQSFAQIREGYDTQIGQAQELKIREGYQKARELFTDSAALRMAFAASPAALRDINRNAAFFSHKFFPNIINLFSDFSRITYVYDIPEKDAIMGTPEELYAEYKEKCKGKDEFVQRYFALDEELSNTRFAKVWDQQCHVDWKADNLRQAEDLYWIAKSMEEPFNSD